MGIGLSLDAAWQVARVSIPTVIESIKGDVSRDVCDRRLRQFAENIVSHARIRLDVRGVDRVPTDRSLIYMSNHQSHMDIPVLYATMPSPTVRMVAKKELFRIPIFGQAMIAADMVRVDRSSRQEAIASLRRASALIDSGVSLWIAPEGTRSRDGKIGPLKKGGFHLAIDTGTPIVPVAIVGTRNILPPGSIRTRPGQTVRVTFGAPIPVDGETVDSLMRKVDAFLREHVEGSAARDPGDAV
ncbi:MAG: 1-acyl-sn-glycerol-3-phosphate acyltransferase [Deltaproteobacteria bacterium]|nr:MAG: 1-acyl-sn-glycerol-3-phosphate acyltransferase [Deltaproteobacteria bacterium]